MSLMEKDGDKQVRKLTVGDVSVLTASTSLDSLLSMAEVFGFNSLIVLPLKATRVNLLTIAAAYIKGNFCTRCGQCCRLLTDGVYLANQTEVNNLAFASGLSRRQFIKRYLFLNGGKPHLRVPCVFQKSNSCSVYNIRPVVCQLYPIRVEVIGNLPRICVWQCPGGRLFSRHVSNEINKRKLPSSQ